MGSDQKDTIKAGTSADVKSTAGTTAEKSKGQKAVRIVLERVLSALFWILVWAVAAWLIHKPLLVSSPAETFRTILAMVATADFWRTVAFTFLRMLGGFSLALTLAFVLALISSKLRFFRILAETPRAFAGSVPLAAFVILALFWFGPDKLSRVISAMVSFPILYSALLTGLLQENVLMDQASDMYRFGFFDKWRHVRWPIVYPFLLSSAGSAMGMCWRSTVAAELITQVARSVGGELFSAKIYLDTPVIFSWMVLLILFGNISEWIMKLLLSLFAPGALLGRSIGKGKQPVAASDTHPSVRLEKVTVEFHDGESVLRLFEKNDGGISLKLDGGNRLAVMGPSGAGKTTLLSVIAGYLTGSGSATVHGTCFMNFSEERLIGHLSGRKNLLMCGFSEEEVLKSLQSLGLTEADADRPVKDYSKGMKRRLSLSRALLGLQKEGSGILLLDEPFSGLDEESRKLAVREVLRVLDEAGDQAVLILVTHEKEEAEALSVAEYCVIES